MVNLQTEGGKLRPYSLATQDFLHMEFSFKYGMLELLNWLVGWFGLNRLLRQYFSLYCTPDLALWLTLIGSNYSCLEHLFSVFFTSEHQKPI